MKIKHRNYIYIKPILQVTHSVDDVWMMTQIYKINIISEIIDFIY